MTIEQWAAEQARNAPALSPAQSARLRAAFTKPTHTRRPVPRALQAA